VASVAVEEPYRRLGVGKLLMERLHLEYYSINVNIKGMQLHCRASNEAAIQHYCAIHGYVIDEELVKYYPDGENGYLMTLDMKDFLGRVGGVQKRLL
jgi:ribosomal protein S18 acetylase RimI-like enzyme